MKNSEQTDYVITAIYEKFIETDLFANAQFQNDAILVSEHWLSISKENATEIYYAIGTGKEVEEQVIKVISDVMAERELEFIIEEWE